MLTALIRLFIADNENTASPKVRQKYGILCGILGIFFNMILFIFKFLAGLISQSIAITADAFNNLSDAGSSIITLIGFQMAGQKPDPHHPYGHGRIEYITGLLVSIAILIMAVELIRSSIEKILNPEPISYSPLILLILLVSIFLKLYMSYYNKCIAKKIQSTAMHATATDSLSDALSTTVVLAATLISHFTGLTIDGFCGVLVGIFIFFAGLGAAKDTISPLLGQAPDREFVAQIKAVVLSYEDVLGVHDLVVHDYGPGRRMISLHAEVPAKGDILVLHDTIDMIEKRLQNELHCDAVIHMDPIMNDDVETMELKQMALQVLAKIDDSLSLHDFRIVKGPTHTNLIFDVVAPFSLSLSPEELKCLITQLIQDINPNCFTVIQVDHP